MNTRHVARDISYASAAQTRAGRALIRLMENASGRVRLIRRAEGYDVDVAAGQDFWQVMTDRYGLRPELISGHPGLLPAQGPLIIVANHPYGILDGLMLGHLLATSRQGDFRVLANHVFRRAPDLERAILPISFEPTKAAADLNIETRTEALAYLRQGGAIGIFPGGTVSTGARPFSTPLDPVWRPFTARLIARSGATVVPVYFEGANSRLFQLASHIHSNLRVGMLLREFRARLDTPVRFAIGEPIPAEQLHALSGDAKATMDFLRKATYSLSPSPLDASRLGHEFEATYRGRAHGGGHIR